MTELDSTPTKEELEEMVRSICKEYNNNFPLTYTINDTQEEIYGPEATKEKIGTIDGAYLPKERQMQLIRNNLPNHRRAKRTIRHELLGHYGLNTLRPEEKRALLERIIEAREEPSLKPHWQAIDKLYTHTSTHQKAEELFAFVAEREPSLTPPVQASSLLSTTPADLLTLIDLEQEAARIADGIRHGEQQKTFPETNKDQFRYSQREHSRSQQKSSTSPVSYSEKGALRAAYLKLDKKEAIGEFPQLGPVYAIEQAGIEFVDANQGRFSPGTGEQFVERVREDALNVLARGETLPDQVGPLAMPPKEPTKEHSNEAGYER